jgi:uncharacterized membrane protein
MMADSAIHAQQLVDLRSPAEFIQVTIRHASAQMGVLTEQAKELLALGQGIVSKSAEPFKK